MTAMLMTQNPAMWLGVIPLAILAAYQASAILNSEFANTALWRRFGLRWHQWLAANKVRVPQVLQGFEAVVLAARRGC